MKKINLQYYIAYFLIAIAFCFVLANPPSDVFGSSIGPAGGGDADSVDGKVPGAASGLATLDADTEVVEPVNLIVDKGGGNNLQVKVIPIGDWDMNAIATFTVTHGLSSRHTIRGIMVVIRDDNKTNYYVLQGAATPPTDAEIQLINSVNVVLFRTVGGQFDDPLFDDVGGAQETRGWVTVWYTE